MMYIVYNGRTEEIKGKYKSRNLALKRRDKFDNEYGAYIHRVKTEDNFIF